MYPSNNRLSLNSRNRTYSKIQKRLRNILLLLTFLFLFISCEKDIPIYKNLIEDFKIADKNIPTTEIIFSKDIDRFLGKGWSKREKKYRWTTGLESDLIFYSFNESDIEMTVKCIPFDIDNMTQTISIYLNATYIKKLILKQGMKNYGVTLPSSLIQEGKNLLKFNYEYAQKPSDHRNSSDNRNLAVGFNKITFHDSLKNNSVTVLALEHQKIKQSPGISLDYYYYIPPGSFLKIKIDEISQGLTGNIEIVSNENKRKHIKIKSPGSRKISLESFSDQYVKFMFYPGTDEEENNIFNGQKNNTITWSSIAIFSKANKRAPLNATNKSSLSKIKNLDVFYIVLDAFNADHSSLYGYERKTTPFLDSLGEKSIVFDNFFANQPYTLASTATLLTSTYSYQHGLIDKEKKLSPSLTIFPEILAKNGIESFLITRHEFFAKTWGLTRGFTKVIKSSFSEDYMTNINKMKDIYDSKYRDKQKFIYLHLMPPHSPYTPPKKYRVFNENLSLSDEEIAENLHGTAFGEIEPTREVLDGIIQQYDNNILFADQIIKEIYDLLREKGVLNKTILIITSDHGEAFFEHGHMQHSKNIYDEMIHIPLILSFPESIDSGSKRVHSIGAIADIAPTILDLFNIESNLDFEGKSLLPRILGFNNKEHIFIESLLVNKRGIRTLKYKYINDTELYDILQDPDETRNLIKDKPIISGYFAQKLRSYDKQNITEAKDNTVNLETLDPDSINHLKTLGYIE